MSEILIGLMLLNWHISCSVLVFALTSNTGHMHVSKKGREKKLWWMLLNANACMYNLSAERLSSFKR
jgi:hypothetical protein